MSEPMPPVKKKMNIRFLAIAVAGLCAVGLFAFSAERWMQRRQDRQTMAWAEKAMAGGKYEEAATEFARAVSRHPNDADLAIKSGDAFYQWSATKPEVLQRAHIAWEAAARMKPDDLPALQRLLNFDLEMAQVRPTAAVFRDLGDTAQKIIRLSASDKTAHTAQEIAALGEWLYGPPNKSADIAHDKVLSALSAGFEHGPTDGLAIYYYSQGAARRAFDFRIAKNASSSQQMLHRAEDQIDLAVRNVPQDDPQDLLRAAQSYVFLAGARVRVSQFTDPATSQPATTQPDQSELPASPPATEPFEPDAVAVTSSIPHLSGEAARCLEKARPLLDNANRLVAPHDPRFLDIRMFSAELAKATGDAAGATRICRETLAQRPGSLRAQLALAELLADSEPAQAIALLERPNEIADAGPGPQALTRREWLVEATSLKASLYLADAKSTEVPGRRDVDIQNASAACDSLGAMLVDTPRSLKLKARLRILQSKYRDALNIVDRALAATNGRRVSDLELVYLRCTCLVALHDTDDALATLRGVLQARPLLSDYRLLLAKVLLEDGRLFEAARHIETLDSQLKDSARTLNLRIELLAGQVAIDPTDTAIKELHTLYSSLPEATQKQKLQKAEQALSIGEADDAIRLLQLARTNDPSAISISTHLAEALSAAHQPGQAEAILTGALREHPGDPLLLRTKKSLTGDESTESYEQLLKDKDDPAFIKAIQAARSAINVRDMPEAKKQLGLATTSKADDPLLIEAEFQYNLIVEHWSEAAARADELAQDNFDHMEGRYYHFQLEMARKQYPAATILAHETTQRYARLPGSWVALGEALLASARYDRAVLAFKQAITVRKDDLPAIKGLAACYRAQGLTKEADNWIAKGRIIAPVDDDLREMELQRQLSQGDPRRLLEAREKAVSDDPQSWENALSLARVYLQIGSVESVSSPSGAKDALKKAVDILDGSIKKWPDEKACYFWAAHAAAVAGDVAGGKQIFQQMAARDAWARRPDAWQLLADYDLTWSDIPGAETALKQAVHCGDTTVITAQRLAGILARQGVWNSAVDALSPYENDPVVQQQRMEYFVAVGRGAQTEKELKSLYNNNPASTRAMTLLGLLYFVEKDDKQALLWLDRAISAGVEGPARRLRGAIRLRQGNAPAAVEDLSIAYEGMPSDTGTGMLLGEAYLRSRDSQRAEQVFRTCTQIAPQDKAARLRLLVLEQSIVPRNADAIAATIQDAQMLAPSDPDWVATEARMWFSRGDAVRGAAVMRHAIALETTRALITGARPQSLKSEAVKSLVRDELSMLLAAHADEIAAREADDVLARYGATDWLCAWAHLARATVLHRKGNDPQSASEFDAAFRTAEAGGNLGRADAILQAIAFEAGPDEALRRIQSHGTASHPDADGLKPPAIVSDPRWDFIRVDLLQNNHRFAEAAQELDRMLPRLADLSSADQIDLLRRATVVYISQRVPQTEKAEAACLALIERKPDDLWALNNMAMFYIEQSHPPDPSQAVTYGRRAYDVMNKSGDIDPRIADTYGWTLLANGSASEAIAVLVPAVERLPIPEIQYHLAEAYLAIGQGSAAWAQLVPAVREIQQGNVAGNETDSKLQQRIADALYRAALMAW